MVDQEIYELNEKNPNLEKGVKVALLPKDEADSKSAIIEVRAGTGGEEAALLPLVYLKCTNVMLILKDGSLKYYQFLTLALGYKEASASIKGPNVFSKLKFESGVHRVQRVPN